MKTSAVFPTRQKWVDLIRQQEQSGKTVKVFCQEQGVNEPSFYSWRKRLKVSRPVGFALVDAGGSSANDNLPIELILASGDRLRIAPGTDTATLRAVLGVLRERA